MAEEETFIEDDVLALDDSSNETEDDMSYTNLVGFVQGR